MEADLQKVHIKLLLVTINRLFYILVVYNMYKFIKNIIKSFFYNLNKRKNKFLKNIYILNLYDYKVTLKLILEPYKEEFL